MQRQAEPDMNRQRKGAGRSPRAGRTACVLALMACAWPFAAAFSAVHAATTAAAERALDDAERFAVLMRDTGFRPSARELSDRYLHVGTSALASFAASRSADAAALHHAVALDRAAYRWAVERCLPAARTLASRWEGLAGAVAASLYIEPADPAPRPVFLFGAGRSAGTVQGDSVVLALEVVCRYVGPEDDAETVLEGFALHELVHHHQLRRQRPEQVDSLLRQAMIEGLADYVAGRLLGDVPAQERERADYGGAHEARLWAAFSSERRGTSLGGWMYGPGNPGEPADLAYWLGKRICIAYVDALGDERRALHDLLELRDPEAILVRSGYADRFPPP